jgi:hypothetical protein
LKKSWTLAVSVAINISMQLCFVSVHGPRETYFVDEPRMWMEEKNPCMMVKESVKKRPLGRLLCNWEDNIKMGLLIDLYEPGLSGSRRRAFIKMAINLWIFLNSWITTDFPARPQLHGFNYCIYNMFKFTFQMNLYFIVTNYETGILNRNKIFTCKVADQTILLQCAVVLLQSYFHLHRR